ncbi:MAG TPA: DUF4139 domain-containing protein [Terriglobia bacterium]|nr:DUF4139 domain-containing protein [Terriglobia bacterium]
MQRNGVLWRRRFGLAAMALLLASAALAAQSIETSTVASRKKLSLTVYNSGMALVRDTREVTIPEGEVWLRLAGVAEKAEPDTVQMVSVTAPHDLGVLEQSYSYNPVTLPKLLDAYVGKTITVVRSRWQNGAVTEEPVQAKLLAANPPVWEVKGQIVTGLETQHYIFPSLPSDFYSQPAFTWLLRNHHSGPQTVEASYLTNGMSWSADYVLVISAAGKLADLTGWVTLKNESGASYPDAALQLIAGHVQRVYRGGVVGGVPGGVPGAFSDRMMAAQAPAPQFVQQPFSAYHLYTLARHATLPDNESKQIRLLGASGVHITRTYEVNGQTYYYRNPEPGAPRHDPVEMHAKFENSKANSLGMPLPEGTVRVYQTDSSGLEQLIGEANIQHTPEGETLNLNVGSAFDVIEERKQTDYQRLSAHSAESSYEVTLRNHQSQSIEVSVNEPFQGDWRVLNSNFSYEKTSAFSARFKVPVKAGGTAVLKYRVQVRWE